MKWRAAHAISRMFVYTVHLIGCIHSVRAGNDDEKMYMPSLKVEGGSAAKLAQAVRWRLASLHARLANATHPCFARAVRKRDNLRAFVTPLILTGLVPSFHGQAIRATKRHG